MRRSCSFLVLVLLAAWPAALKSEEIQLKDGTKIVGHMTALTPDKLEVETSYGKIQLKRADILTISFPENAPAKPAEAAPSRPEAPKMDESLQGVRYLNRTAKFSLTLPSDWIISDLHRNPGTLTVLSSRDKTRFVLVSQEDYPGSLESYKELAMLVVRKNFSTYEELAQSSVTIDGKQALLVFYRATPAKSFPLAFVSAIIPSGNTYTKVTAWCIDPLFHDMQPAFEKILTSYHTTGQITASSGPGLP